MKTSYRLVLVPGKPGCSYCALTVGTDNYNVGLLVMNGPEWITHPTRWQWLPQEGIDTLNIARDELVDRGLIQD